MGKSRLIDELSREDFLIPINLRPHNSKGLSRLLISCLSLRNRFYRILPSGQSSSSVSRGATARHSFIGL
ncbi:hypothetical protein B0F90DRAFT_1773771 [Multifurca ochricompacta]|uniref:Uncharacterized protein n=1 Tax=Multifurca ochricompacta TaxID=376703 RepID=A0AAD4QJJ4_9AGAM|nr:hypothetical protein B0F90DRAFT_1773771 [Multifurca ochricompacta]